MEVPKRPLAISYLSGKLETQRRSNPAYPVNADTRYM